MPTIGYWVISMAYKRRPAAIYQTVKNPDTFLRIPMKTATDSGGKRPSVPIQNGHFGLAAR